MSKTFPWQEATLFFDILRQVQKPGRYTGGEWNVSLKDPKKVSIKIALAFPDVYEIGMSYLGQKILYDVLNAQPDILAERVFAPWPDMEVELRRRGWPLFSLENRLPLRSFDFVGFSLLYELNYSNILTMLDLGQIPLKAEERKENDPLVIGGGPGALNPEPLAPFFDLFLLGDGEEAFLEIIKAYQELRQTGANRLAILKRLALIEGVYVPLFYQIGPTANSLLLVVKPKEDVPPIIRKRILFPFSRAKFPTAIIVPNIQIIHDRVAMEVARGCPQKCRFCQATSIYFPFRPRYPEEVLRTILASLDSTGYENASLTALSISDYPYFEEIVRGLIAELELCRISLSLSSLRPSGLKPEAVKNILRIRKTGFTIVPEAGTERLRQVINKSLDDLEVFKAVQLAFSYGWHLLKLYFMVGLPTETREDLDGLIRMTQDILNLGRKLLHRPPQINLSLSPFIPKPHTPFQWLAMAPAEELREKLAYIRSRLRRFSSIKIKDRRVEMAQVEAAFSRGDRRLASVLEGVWRKGARFDSWGDNFNFSLWQEAFYQAGVSIEDYLGPLSLEAELPWDHCYPGINKEHLKRELAKAWQGRVTPSCLESVCPECQGCENPQLFKLEVPSFSLPQEPPLPKKVKGTSEKKAVYRYLVFYEKTGLARFLSHLDIMRTISRALRRAKISVCFSQGFHPKMELSFPPPLPLGLEGYEECFEFKSFELLEAKEFLAATNTSLPSGIGFISLKEVPLQAPALAKRLEATLYFLPIFRPDVSESIKRAKEKEIGDSIIPWLEEKIKEITPSLKEGEKVWLDCPSFRLYFRQPLFSGSFQPRNFLEKKLGLAGISFYLVREKFLFRAEE